MLHKFLKMHNIYVLLLNSVYLLTGQLSTTSTSVTSPATTGKMFPITGKMYLFSLSRLFLNRNT